MNKTLLKKLAKRQRIISEVLYASQDAHIQHIPFCKIPQSPYARQRLLDKGLTVPSSHTIRIGSYTMFSQYETLPSYLPVTLTDEMTGGNPFK